MRCRVKHCQISCIRRSVQSVQKCLKIYKLRSHIVMNWCAFLCVAVHSFIQKVDLPPLPPVSLAYLPCKKAKPLELGNAAHARGAGRPESQENRFCVLKVAPRQREDVFLNTCMPLSIPPPPTSLLPPPYLPHPPHPNPSRQLSL